jgi:hypothetical protein
MPLECRRAATAPPSRRNRGRQSLARAACDVASPTRWQPDACHCRTSPPKPSRRTRPESPSSYVHLLCSFYGCSDRLVLVGASSELEPMDTRPPSGSRRRRRQTIHTSPPAPDRPSRGASNDDDEQMCSRRGVEASSSTTTAPCPTNGCNGSGEDARNSDGRRRRSRPSASWREQGGAGVAVEPVDRRSDVLEGADPTTTRRVENGAMQSCGSPSSRSLLTCRVLPVVQCGSKARILDEKRHRITETGTVKCPNAGGREWSRMFSR